MAPLMLLLLLSAGNVYNRASTMAITAQKLPQWKTNSKPLSGEALTSPVQRWAFSLPASILECSYAKQHTYDQLHPLGQNKPGLCKESHPGIKRLKLHGGGLQKSCTWFPSFLNWQR
jgi:hypothetical protein